MQKKRVQAKLVERDGEKDRALDDQSPDGKKAEGSVAKQPRAPSSPVCFLNADEIREEYKD